MIRYALVCPSDHTFESWFRDSQTYDAQLASGHIECPVCGSRRIRKAIMAPAVALGADKQADAAEEPQAEDAGAALDLRSEQEQALVEALRKFNRYVKANAEYVGPGFADEVRRMHLGDIEERPVYGEASRKDILALQEEGIDMVLLPALPQDSN